MFEGLNLSGIYGQSLQYDPRCVHSDGYIRILVAPPKYVPNFMKERLNENLSPLQGGLGETRNWLEKIPSGGACIRGDEKEPRLYVPGMKIP